jgi:hypothetical protein
MICYQDYTQDLAYLNYLTDVLDKLAEKGVEPETLSKVVDTDEVHEIVFRHLKDMMSELNTVDAILNFINLNEY